MKKKPYYLFAWIFGEAAFFLTIGVVVLYIILNSVAGATSGSITLFTNWYQTLLFVCDVVCLLGVGVFVTLAIMQKIKMGKGEENEA